VTAASHVCATAKKPSAACQQHTIIWTAHGTHARNHALMCSACAQVSDNDVYEETGLFAVSLKNLAEGPVVATLQVDVPSRSGERTISG
jgi:hypothetical protein